jgi:hypothetical protein
VCSKIVWRFFAQLTPGTHTCSYLARVTHAGTFYPTPSFYIWRTVLIRFGGAPLLFLVSFQASVASSSWDLCQPSFLYYNDNVNSRGRPFLTLDAKPITPAHR